MATYPIKMLKDEQGTPFVPLVSTQAVRNPNGQTVEDILDSKLSPTNIKEGENIVVTVSGNDVTITADVPDTTVLVDNLNQTTAGIGALDARQGNVLLNTVNAKAVPTGGNAGQVLKKRTNDDNDLEWGDAADPNAISGDGSIKKIVEITYEDYQALATIDPDTEYHIIESTGYLIDYRPVVLYSSNGEKDLITLNDDVSNYEYIEILYRSGDYMYDSMKIYQPEGKRIEPSFIDFRNGADQIYFRGNCMLIHNNTIANTTHASVINYGVSKYNVLDTSLNTFSDINDIYIYRVLGYK